MNPYYQTSSPLARRATVPISLAPTASMIDPSLNNYSIEPLHQQQQPSQQQQQQQQQQAQMIRNHGAQNVQPPGQTQISNNNHLQSPMKSNSRISSPSNHFPSQRVQLTQPNSSERHLPAQQVTDQTIDDAYVQFIIYCNPHISADTDTGELRRGFRNPPKSDGKSFKPYSLFELISKLERKDGINTWVQLVLELGVEPPNQEKGQSSQKVQQYAVRLKRWLHAYHVDAFFNYLLGRPTSYQTERPLPGDAVADVARDSIPPEDDLAIRALLPEWRPKRGRKKAEEGDGDGDTEAHVAKKTNTGSASNDFGSMFEDQYSAAPSSAIAWSAQGNSADAWMAAQIAIAPKTPNSGQPPSNNQLNAQRANSQMSWRYNNNESGNTPSTPYPHSAVTPRQQFSASPKFDEPRSAHPVSTSKSPSRARRRHAPAVSSAWPSTTSGSSGKIRGRPPSNRSIQDGPFSTFPANPQGKESSNANSGNQNTGGLSPAPEPKPTPPQHYGQSTQPSPAPLPTLNTPSMNGNPTTAPQQQASQPPNARKPSKLQLQVPAHSGGPVRLATPPRVLINGESNQPIGRSVSTTSSTKTQHERRSSADFFNQLDEISEDDGGGAGPNLDDGGGGGASASAIGLPDDDEGTREDWKRRALILKRRLAEKEEELKAVKRRVLDAVM